MTTAQTQTPLARTVTLATYCCDTEQRQIVGQRIDGAVQLRDEPTDTAGQVYVIEDDLHSKAEMDAIIADYLQRAQLLGYPPMFSLGW